MKAIRLLIFLTVAGFQIQAQQYFAHFKPVKYQTALVRQRLQQKDSNWVDYIDFKRIKGLENIRIEMWIPNNLDTAIMSIYQNGRRIRKILFPEVNRVFALNKCEVADLDNNQLPDIKLTIEGSGNGLAALLSYKVYLFNFRERFAILSFFDFSDTREYDMDGDGAYEILSRDHTLYQGHSYWVYNAYDFVDGRLRNVSEKFDYPLWTRMLFRSDTIVARNIPRKERLKQLARSPDETVIY